MFYGNRENGAHRLGRVIRRLQNGGEFVSKRTLLFKNSIYSSIFIFFLFFSQADEMKFLSQI